tara:strand:+ start:1964 stop:2320 length:357 start_codon:yes stop_codon:yes gene_type:complete
LSYSFYNSAINFIKPIKTLRNNLIPSLAIIGSAFFLSLNSTLIILGSFFSVLLVLTITQKITSSFGSLAVLVVGRWLVFLGSCYMFFSFSTEEGLIWLAVLVLILVLARPSEIYKAYK